MQKYKYPHPNFLKITNETNINLINKYEGISLCNIECPDLEIPLLPYRNDNKLIFPTGKFKGWHTHVELRKALQLGYKIEPIKTHYFTKNFKPFKKFVNDMYTERMSQKYEPMKLVYKILMSSLYGKFAQKLNQSELYFMKGEDREKVFNFLDYNYFNKCERYKVDFIKELRYIDNEGNNISYPLISNVTDTENTKYPKFINPIFSIYTTSYARLELYKLFEKVNKVYYCDTDSIFTDTELKTSYDLGDIKLEMKVKKGIIVKPKFYYVESKDKKEFVKVKGCRNLKDYSDFNDLLKTKKNVYIKFSKFKESLRRNLNFNEKILMEKIIDIEDNKRIWKKKFNKNELQKGKAISIN